MDREVGHHLTMHQVRKVMEVQVNLANELLEAGWILHDIYINNENQSRYIMLCMEEILCPRCGATATLEVLEEGERLRYICTKECS